MLDDEKYSEYVKDQTEINKRKIHRVFEYEENVKMLSNYIKQKFLQFQMVSVMALEGVKNKSGSLNI